MAKSVVNLSRRPGPHLLELIEIVGERMVQLHQRREIRVGHAPVSGAKGVATQQTQFLSVVL